MRMDSNIDGLPLINNLYELNLDEQTILNFGLLESEINKSELDSHDCSVVIFTTDKKYKITTTGWNRNVHIDNNVEMPDFIQPNTIYIEKDAVLAKPVNIVRQSNDSADFEEDENEDEYSDKYEYTHSTFYINDTQNLHEYKKLFMVYDDFDAGFTQCSDKLITSKSDIQKALKETIIKITEEPSFFKDSNFVTIGDVSIVDTAGILDSPRLSVAINNWTNAFDIKPSCPKSSKDINYSFVCTFNENSEYKYQQNYSREANLKLNRIEYVYEFNNTRLAVLTSGESVICNCNSDYYNYIDAGFYILTSTDYWNSKNNWIKIINSDDTRFTIKPEVLYKFTRYCKNSVITADEINNSGKVIKAYEDMENLEKESAKLLADKINLKIKEVKTGLSNLIINGVDFSMNKIEYQGQELSCDDIENMSSKLLEILIKKYSLESVDFDRTFDEFLNLILVNSIDHRNSNSIGIRSVKAKIGNINVHVSHERKKTKNGSQARTEINSVRINKDEIEECLKRSLCFTTNDEYNKFLQSVSSCSLKVHNLISSGLSLNVYEPLTDDHIFLQLNFTRKNGANYIIIDGNTYKIHNTAKIFSLDKKGNVISVMTSLINNDVVEGVTIEHARKILEEGKNNYQAAKKQMEDFLKTTEKILNLKRVQNYTFINNHTVEDGYIVTGKIKSYVVDLKGKHNVYDKDTGKYLCMVDKASTVQTGYDHLVSRLYSLANDNLVSSEIHTLN